MLVHRAVPSLRQVKHWIVFESALGRRTRPLWHASRDHVIRRLRARRPFVPNAGRYRNTWLGQPAPAPSAASVLPRLIWVLWTGDNELPANRRRGLDAIKEHNSDIEIRLVTARSLEQWILPDHPLHPAYTNLSLVHRSDYLRAYLLNHYGGGYTDVKASRHPWGPVFDVLEKTLDAYVVGYPEVGSNATAHLPGRLGHDLRWAYPQLIGGGAVICRSQTPFTLQWLAQIHHVLDAHQDALGLHPGDAYGRNTGYPLQWEEIMARIYHPLQLKYLDHVIHDSRLRPELLGYR